MFQFTKNTQIIYYGTREIKCLTRLDNRDEFSLCRQLRSGPVLKSLTLLLFLHRNNNKGNDNLA